MKPQDEPLKLALHVNSINLSEDILKPNTKIRVTIKTFPENSKQELTINAAEIKNAFRLCKLIITSKTDFILFIFRQFDILENHPIFASTILRAVDFPKLNSCNEHIIGVYETTKPNSCGIEISQSKYMNNRKLGTLELQILLTKFYDERSNNSSRNNICNLGKNLLINRKGKNNENENPQKADTNSYYT